MKVIDFKECNTVYAEDQPEYLPLPAHKSDDGVVTSCWGLNIKERLKVLFSGKIFLQVLTFNKPLQPLKMVTDNPAQKSAAPRCVNTAELLERG